MTSGGLDSDVLPSRKPWVHASTMERMLPAGSRNQATASPPDDHIVWLGCDLLRRTPAR